MFMSSGPVDLFVLVFFIAFMVCCCVMVIGVLSSLYICFIIILFCLLVVCGVVFVYCLIN